jgi:hypothetical protein
MSCKCSEYEHLEFRRAAISKRIRQSKKLKKTLQMIVEHGAGEHKLLKCPECDQYWQSSRAWNWGNDEYLFKVPDITSDEWLQEPYIQPDELLIYDAVMRNYMDQEFPESSRQCRVADCDEHALTVSVFCLWHHIESLQESKVLPKEPDGRWFPPYHREGSSPNAS